MVNLRMKLEQKAREFAEKAHEGQFRKDGQTPYISHCAGVVDLLRGEGVKNEDILCTGWLHDVIEDCGITREQLKQEFNINIARMVSQLTRDIDREAYKERIRKADYGVQIVKLADTVHNCSEMTHPNITQEMIRRKVEDCESLYFRLAKEICPNFNKMLIKYLEPWRKEKCL